MYQFLGLSESDELLSVLNITVICMDVRMYVPYNGGIFRASIYLSYQLTKKKLVVSSLLLFSFVLWARRVVMYLAK